MATTKDTLIFDGLLAVNGGVVTPNMSTRYGDAESYLAEYFNYVQLGTYWLESKAEGEHAINPACLVPFDNVPLLYSTTRQRWYSTLPTPVVAIPKGRALKITDENGKLLIPLTQGDDAMQEYYGKYDKQLKYMLEGNNTVWFWGIENRPLLKFIRPSYIASIRDMPGTAEVLLPADGEKAVVDYLIQRLTGERAAPKQYSEDGKDVVKV